MNTEKLDDLIQFYLEVESRFFHKCAHLAQYLKEWEEDNEPLGGDNPHFEVAKRIRENAWKNTEICEDGV